MDLVVGWLGGVKGGVRRARLPLSLSPALSLSLTHAHTKPKKGAGILGLPLAISFLGWAAGMIFLGFSLWASW